MSEGFVSSKRNLLDKASAAQNLDGNRLTGSLLVPVTELWGPFRKDASPPADREPTWSNGYRCPLCAKSGREGGPASSKSARANLQHLREIAFRVA
jgi:hypothetical protein